MLAWTHFSYLCIFWTYSKESLKVKAMQKPQWSASCTAQLVLILALACRLVLAGEVNVTVDDQYGDPINGAMPVYAPSSVWNQGASCSACFVKPDVSQVYRGTWHDSTHNSADSVENTIQFTFTGTAVYVYFIIPNTVEGADTTTAVRFSIDGVQTGIYRHIPNTTGQLAYNFLVHAHSGLDNTTHNLLMETTSSFTTIMLFDYLIYTMDVDDTPSSLQPSSASSTPVSSTSKSVSTATSSGTNTPSTSPVSITTLSRPIVETITGASGVLTLSTIVSSVSTIFAAEPSGTTNSESSSGNLASGRDHTALVVGLTVGLLLGAILLALLLLLCYRRRRKHVYFDLLDNLPSPRERETDMPPPAFEEIFEKTPYPSTLYESGVALPTLTQEKHNSRKSALPPSEYGYGVGMSELADKQSHDFSKIDSRPLSTFKEVPPLRFSSRSSRRMDRNSAARKQSGSYAAETYQLNSLSERSVANIP